MKSLRIVQAKPNPAGKDRAAWSAPTAQQLGGEWVDIRNVGTAAVNLQPVDLYHKAYKSDGSWDWERVTSFTNWALPPGAVLRVHSGQARELSTLRQEDLHGADYHSFTGRDSYVWNNRQGDTPLLFEGGTKETIDSASYDANPPEGAVLARAGDKLVPQHQRASAW